MRMLVYTLIIIIYLFFLALRVAWAVPEGVPLAGKSLSVVLRYKGDFNLVCEFARVNCQTCITLADFYKILRNNNNKNFV